MALNFSRSITLTPGCNARPSESSAPSTGPDSPAACCARHVSSSRADAARLRSGAGTDLEVPSGGGGGAAGLQGCRADGLSSSDAAIAAASIASSSSTAGSSSSPPEDAVGWRSTRGGRDICGAATGGGGGGGGGEAEGERRCTRNPPRLSKSGGGGGGVAGAEDEARDEATAAFETSCVCCGYARGVASSPPSCLCRSAACTCSRDVACCTPSRSASSGRMITEASPSCAVMNPAA